MDVTTVSNAPAYNTQTTQHASRHSNQDANANNVNGDVIANEAAVYEKSKPEKYAPDMNKIKEMIAETDRATELLRQLVEKLLLKQGSVAKSVFELFGVGEEFYKNLEADDATILKAQQEISEDGYFGVLQTSQRILDFAKALSGGDPSKIDLLEEAFIKGFQMAEEIWGGKLPDISYQTYDAVMQGFAEWRASA